MAVVNILSPRAIRGDLWQYVIPFTRFDPDDATPDLAKRRRIPLTEAEVVRLKATYTVLQLTARTGAKPEEYDTVLSLSSADGEVVIDVPLRALAVYGPAIKMTGFHSARFDIQLTQPRPDNPLGDNITTWAKGNLVLDGDVTP